MVIFHETIGIIAAILTVAIGIPQLVKIIRTRMVKDISLVSNWIFFCGLTIWVVFSSFTSSNGTRLWHVGLANVLSTLVYSIMLFWLHKLNKASKQTQVGLIIGLSIVFVAVVIIFTCGMIFKDATYGKIVGYVLAFIAAGITTFAYIPQIIKMFASKDVESLSLLMLLIFVTLNLLWIIYWVTPYEESVLMSLIFQCLSLAIFTAQLIFYFMFKKPKKANNQIENTESKITE